MNQATAAPEVTFRAAAYACTKEVVQLTVGVIAWGLIIYGVYAYWGAITAPVAMTWTYLNGLLTPVQWFWLTLAVEGLMVSGLAWLVCVDKKMSNGLPKGVLRWTFTLTGAYIFFAMTAITFKVGGMAVPPEEEARSIVVMLCSMFLAPCSVLLMFVAVNDRRVLAARARAAA